MKKTFPSNHNPNFNRQPPCPAYRYRKPGFQSNHNHRVDRPPERNSPRQPNFILKLHFGCGSVHRDDVECLISKCKPNPDNFCFYPCDGVAASLNFIQWTDAREAVVWFWESRFAGGHGFTPELISNVMVPSDRVELEGRLRSLFVSHVKELMEGKEVKKWVEEWDGLSKEIARVKGLLGKPFPVRVQQQHIERKKGLDDEKSLVEKRLKEFEFAMESILQHLEESNNVESGEDFVPVFRFDGSFDWKKIHSLIVRERRRLEEGLPIYAYRQEILQQIHHQQITVLIGETGSGKSTQIVQFLADSGIGADGSIVCTQPRKIAAKSLAQRVQEESSGCYEESSIQCVSTFSSTPARLPGFHTCVGSGGERLLPEWYSEKGIQLYLNT